ncbi:polyprenol monophosphomannose synthase [Mangrovibacterium marinum]|uniref:Dolichol-phosphate mannosyltransferase n=1 Tax=Mangrovibacterium marinum TaxID=1639118 RepID=A0A2T5BZI9_9BACT|nr:polyprenol monophosphomannose synthase [Mangrovibacterium marinum]PTN07697.1 dolichol-phosphate mannosyltransferase [Mangrovibacterium marinum]
MKINLVIIPTYNEKENIERMVRKVFSLPRPFELLIIDDNSPDGTAEIVKKLQLEFPKKLHLLQREGKLGLGTAYLSGFKWALNYGADYIFEMDCDFSHNPEDLERLLDACEKQGGDVAIGSRYIKGINVINWPLGRVLMSYCASVYVRFITGMKVMDTTAGFKCFSRRVLETIDLDNIRLKGYGFQVEMKFTAWKHGFNLVEVPIIFTDRQEGSSKMSGGIFNEALWGILKMKMHSWFTNYQPKAD